MEQFRKGSRHIYAFQLFRLAEQRWFCRSLATCVQPILHQLADVDLATDLSSLLDLVLVEAVAPEKLAALQQSMQVLINGVSTYRSRFARALCLFPTGKVIQESVNRETHSVEQFAATKSLLDEVVALVEKWEEVKVVGGAGCTNPNKLSACRTQDWG